MVKTGGMDTKKKTASTVSGIKWQVCLNNLYHWQQDAYHCLAQSFSAGHDVPQSGAPSTHPDFSNFKGAIYNIKGCEILHPA